MKAKWNLSMMAAVLLTLGLTGCPPDDPGLEVADAVVHKDPGGHTPDTPDIPQPRECGEILNPQCDPNECKMANGDEGRCRLHPDLGCFCDKIPADDRPCGEILNPTCDPNECKMANGDEGRCRLHPDLGCFCDKIPADNDPCGEILNPQCDPNECKMLNGDEGRCRLDPDRGCFCDQVPINDHPCGDVLNPTCDPNECSLADGTVGLCKIRKRLCVCEPRVPTCVVDADCLPNDWTVDCGGHWDCVDGTCKESCGKPCGDGTCDPTAGESPDTCSIDCPTCETNQDCSRGEWCFLEAGVCKGTGVCMPRPPLCPKGIVPVCGCDGNDYSSACEAAQGGINVLATGPCI